ncbi:hypothetical protein HK102_002642 [Quaeritorhiza haematococci]|nr:hypothetical protein HK102_002642 [Quaeritorhiza haematococci]
MLSRRAKAQNFPEGYTRIVAVGDLHGDLRSTLAVLRMAGVVNEERRWVGGRTVLVQTGDIVDRGPDTLYIFYLMRRLEKQAAAAGGRVIVLLGNHEAMNLVDDLRFVHPRDILVFGGAHSRAVEWSEEGDLGAWLRKRDVAVVVNGTLFAHAGITPSYADLTLPEINTKTRKALTDHTLPDLYDPTGPLWYRGYADDPDSFACPQVQTALHTLKAERMVIGHTVQEDGRIAARCFDYNPTDERESSPDLAPRLYLIDVGISRAYNAVGKAVLEIVVRRDVGSGEDRTVSVKALYERSEVVLEGDEGIGEHPPALIGNVNQGMKREVI